MRSGRNSSSSLTFITLEQSITYNKKGDELTSNNLTFLEYCFDYYRRKGNEMCLKRQRFSPLPSISINLSDIIYASFLLGIEV